MPAILTRDKAERLKQAGQFEVNLEQRKLRAALKRALKKYVDHERSKLACAHCGKPQDKWLCAVILHHPDNDGHKGRVGDLVNACAAVEQIDAEIARCVPLCGSCHSKEHMRMSNAELEAAA